MKNIFMYIIVIAVVAVGAWLFMRKGSSTSGLYDASPSPTMDASASVSPTATPVSSPMPSPAGKVITTSDGLQYQDEVMGTGAVAKAGQTVSVNYTGMFTNGTKFDSNVDPAFGHVQPFSFALGASQVIKGWDEGVVGMKVGGTRELMIPAAIAYGSTDVHANPNDPTSPVVIPANSVLVFQVQLLGVK